MIEASAPSHVNMVFYGTRMIMDCTRHQLVYHKSNINGTWNIKIENNHVWNLKVFYSIIMTSLPPGPVTSSQSLRCLKIFHNCSFMNYSSHSFKNFISTYK